MKYLKPLGLLRNELLVDILANLDTNPQLWNQHKLRTTFENTPHQVDDIWLRYNPWEAYTSRLRDMTKALAIQLFVSEEHDSVWYPAIDKLPALRYLIFDLMQQLEAERLGGILITRIPPGGEVRPHIDRGWHAGYYCKVAVQLRSHPDQAFHFEDGAFSCAAGTVYTFDNSQKHWVSNNSPVERITAIICMHADRWKSGLAEMPGELLCEIESS